MIEIIGQFNTAKCFATTVEDGAMQQIKAVCDTEEFSSSKIRIMPDVHAGKGCTIGTTMTVTDKIVPSMVGVDYFNSKEEIYSLRQCSKIFFECFFALDKPKNTYALMCQLEKDNGEWKAKYANTYRPSYAHNIKGLID